MVPLVMTNKYRFLAVLAIFIAAHIPTARAVDEAPALTLTQLTGFIPADIRLKKAGKWEAVGMQLATQAMRDKALNKPTELTFKVEAVEPHPFNGHAICIRSKPASVKVGGLTMPLLIWAYFPSESVPELRDVSKGNIITVTGNLEKAAVELRDGDANLVCNLVGCHVKPAEPAAD
jgi:hypothetical protein